MLIEVRIILHGTSNFMIAAINKYRIETPRPTSRSRQTFIALFGFRGSIRDGTERDVVCNRKLFLLTYYTFRHTKCRCILIVWFAHASPIAPSAHTRVVSFFLSVSWFMTAQESKCADGVPARLTLLAAPLPFSGDWLGVLGLGWLGGVRRAQGLPPKGRRLLQTGEGTRCS